MRRSSIFLLSFLTVFLIQMLIWQSTTITDHSVWLQRLEQFHHDLLHPADFKQKHYSSHPGTAALMLGVVFHTLRMPLTTSFILSTAILISLSIAGIATICLLLAPHSRWWIAAAGLLAFQPLYLLATPPSAVVAPLAALIVVYSLYLYRQEHIRLGHHLLLALMIGVALATRLPVTIVIATPFLLLLSWQFGISTGLAIGTLATMLLVSLNPLLWYIPLDYLGYVMWSVNFHLNQDVPIAPLSPISFFLLAPLFLVSMTIAAGILLSVRKKGFIIPMKFLLTLFLLTGIVMFIFLRSKSQSLRYFYPLIFIWDTFLPLFLFFIIERMPSPSQHRLLRLITPTTATAALISGRVSFLAYSLLLAEGII